VQLGVVALICGMFLMHLRSALVSVVVLPLGIVVAFLAMWGLGVSANIMSLGGIAIALGVMVDASVVMVENLHRHAERDPDAEPATLVTRAATEVGPALFFSLLVVTVSFLPVFALQQQEGRLFTPLAWTKTLAMSGAAVLAITVIPALMVFLARGRLGGPARRPVFDALVSGYRALLRGVLAYPVATLAVALLVALSAWWPASRLGSEFMPPLDEGDLLYMPTTPPGISITTARDLLQETDRLIAQHPQVAHVLGKIGRADTATDPAPLSMIETTVVLTPRDTWPEGKQLQDVVEELDALVDLPGVTNAWTMPIKTRIDMLATGIKTPVGIKLLGDDLAELASLGEQVERVLQDLPGTSSVYAERVMGGSYVDVRVRREVAARYGLNVADIQEVLSSAVGGMNVTETVEGLERYPVSVRFPRELRGDLDALREVDVPTPMGHTVPLGQVADISLSKGPTAIKSENARRTAWVYVDLNTEDVGGYVAQAKERVASQVRLPDGVSIMWSGQYEYMERANERLSVLVPLTIGLIVVLLYTHFRRFDLTALVLAGTLVFSPVGGVWLMYGMGFNLSVAVGVGFIALAGLAAETAVVMLVYVEAEVEARRERGQLATRDDLVSAVIEGATARVRPVLMTVLTDGLGLVPIMWGTGTGARVMKRIATPMIGGVVSTAVLALVLLPAMYVVWQGLRLRTDASSADEALTPPA
jgi:Cu(I)/Ag(I) efflux system membrane protein CusA/SilA